MRALLEPCLPRLSIRICLRQHWLIIVRTSVESRLVHLLIWIHCSLRRAVERNFLDMADELQTEMAEMVGYFERNVAVATNFPC